MHMGKEEFPKDYCFNVYAQGDLGSLWVKKGAFNQTWSNDLFALLRGRWQGPLIRESPTPVNRRPPTLFAWEKKPNLAKQEIRKRTHLWLGRCWRGWGLIMSNNISCLHRNLFLGAKCFTRIISLTCPLTLKASTFLLGLRLNRRGKKKKRSKELSGKAGFGIQVSTFPGQVVLL